MTESKNGNVFGACLSVLLIAGVSWLAAKILEGAGLDSDRVFSILSRYSGWY